MGSALATDTIPVLVTMARSRVRMKGLCKSITNMIIQLYKAILSRKRSKEINACANASSEAQG